MSELWNLMKEHEEITKVILWILTGGVFNVVLFYYMYAGRKHYNKVVKPELIENGKHLEGFFRTVDKYGLEAEESDGGDWIFIFVFGNFCTWFLANFWYVGLTVYSTIIVVGTITWAVSYIHNNFLKEEHTVTRFLKNHPEMVVTILKDETHLYYAVAKRLEAAGTIEINKSDQSVKIDGKEYFLKMK